MDRELLCGTGGQLPNRTPGFEVQCSIQLSYEINDRPSYLVFGATWCNRNRIYGHYCQIALIFPNLLKWFDSIDRTASHIRRAK